MPPLTFPDTQVVLPRLKVSLCFCSSLLRANTGAQNSPSMVKTTKYGSSGEGSGEKQHLNVIFAEQPAQRPLLSIKTVRPIDPQVQN